VRFIVDAQLPALLCTFFTQHGFDAQHVIDTMDLATSDEQIFAFARDND
jgi:predicted nuclease of predicted toxin-antitoxin system